MREKTLKFFPVLPSFTASSKRSAVVNVADQASNKASLLRSLASRALVQAACSEAVSAPMDAQGRNKS